MEILMWIMGVVGFILIAFVMFCACISQESSWVAFFIFLIGVFLIGGAITVSEINTKYIVTSENVTITRMDYEKGNHIVFFEGSHNGSVSVKVEEFATLKEGDKISINVTDIYKFGKYQTTYYIKEE